MCSCVTEALCPSCHPPQWLFKIIFWLGYCNSMMNPIIYACSSREFKRAFIRILRCQYRRRRPQLPLPGDVSTPSSTWYAINASLSKVKGLARRSQKRRNAKQKSGRYSLSEGNSLENGSPMMSMRMYNFNERGSTFEASTVSDDDSGEHVMSEESTSGKWTSPVKVSVSPGCDLNQQNAWSDPPLRQSTDRSHPLCHGTDYSHPLCHGTDHSRPFCHGSDHSHPLCHGSDHSHPLYHGHPSDNPRIVIKDVQTTDIPFASMAHCIDHCRPRVCNTRGPFLGPPRRTIFLPHRR